MAQVDSWGPFNPFTIQFVQRTIRPKYFFSLKNSVFCESVFNVVGPRLLPSHRVDCDVDLEAGGGVPQECADVVLEEVSDPVELHDVARFLVEPELVELDEEVAVKVVEVTQRRNDVAIWWKNNDNVRLN